MEDVEVIHRADQMVARMDLGENVTYNLVKVVRGYWVAGVTQPARLDIVEFSASGLLVSEWIIYRQNEDFSCL